MSIFLCPHFQSLSEFIPSSTGEVSHGDCGWDGLLMAANTYDPARFPLTGDGLAALRDDAIAHGYADANGAVNIPNLDRYLTDHGYPHRTVGYAQFDLTALHTLLASYLAPGGVRAPIIVETSTAGAGLPEDEAGVQYHYFTVAGEDSTTTDGDGATGGYLRGDGDAVKYNSWPGPKYPLATSWSEIAKTNPVGYIILDGVPPAAPGSGGGNSVIVPQGWTDNPATQTLTAPNGQNVVRGIRFYVLTFPGGWDPTNVPLEAEHLVSPYVEHHNHPLGAAVRQLFLRTIVRWDAPSDSAKQSDAGAEVQACEAELATAQAALVAARQATSDMQSQREAISAKLDAETTAAAQAATQAAQQIASLQQQLADALSHPAPAPDPVAEDAKAALAELKKVIGELP